MFKNKDYSFLSKILHHLALGNNFIPEMLHDIEFSIFKKKLKFDNLAPHIFICGMPRSGTTMLMRYIYETQEFASLTYRDMPFITSPNLWSKISNKIKTKPEIERAHGDKISININSPEALEEIFWKVKMQKKYIYSKKLALHEVDEFTLNEFKNFVSLILHKYSKKLYLSKNNNNISRLISITKAFPNCLIIIPFRDPIQQANSLLSQHKNFTKIQNENKFVKSYMTYLAHHEFGAIYRPFEFESNFETNFDFNSLEYWLEQWIIAYTYLTREKFSQKNNILYLNYESFCDNPIKILKKIFKKTNLGDLHYEKTFQIEKSKKKIDIENTSLVLKSEEVFNKLIKLNNNCFS